MQPLPFFASWSPRARNGLIATALSAASSGGCIDVDAISDDNATATEEALSSGSVASTPADGAISVAPNATIQLRFAHAIDADTAISAHVRLYSKDELLTAIATRVTLDDTHRILTVDPIDVLLGGPHVVIIDGVRTRSGASVRKQIDFSVIWNSYVSSRYIGDDGSGYTSQNTLDDQGRISLERYFEDDGTLSGQVISYYRPNLAFPLQVWSFDSAGPDNWWSTRDDVIGSGFRWEYDRRGFKIADVYPGAGPDGVFNTRDDAVLSNARDSVVGPTTSLRRYWQSDTSDVGAHPSNDTLTGYDRLTLDAAGLEIHRAHYSDPGVDRIWLTDDDVNTHNNHWYRTAERTIYTGEYAGEDGVFGTADDEGYGANTLLNADGTERYSFQLADDGPDLTWGTADDEIVGAMRYTRANGAITLTEDLVDPGVDGAWDTADDVVGSYVRDDVTATGARSRHREVYAPGPDGIWFTADDPVTYEERYNTTR